MKNLLQNPIDLLPMAHVSSAFTYIRRAFSGILPATTMKFGNSALLSVAVAAVANITLGTQARAQMQPTNYGTQQGFTLSTWGTGFTVTNGLGPLGIISLGNGKVLVSQYNGDLLLFPYDTPLTPGGSFPTQPASTATLLANFGGVANANGLGVVVGNPTRYFMGQSYIGGGQVVEIVPTTGAILGVVANVPGARQPLGFPPASSISAYAGHLFVSSGDGIWDVNLSVNPPTSSQWNHFESDGIAFTPSGEYLMIANSSGFNVFKVTGPNHEVPDYHVYVDGADGIALYAGHPNAAGKAYINTNGFFTSEGGEVIEVVYDTNPGNSLELEPPASPIVHAIAHLGSRGDYISVDTRVLCSSGQEGNHWPSLLITQLDSIVRIDPPDSGFFGPPFSVEAVINDNQRFCAGDGSLATPCPCFNFGLPGQGCDNSIGSGGALLSVTGSTVPDTMVMDSSGELPSVTSVFLQGTANIANGVVFGDGVRCAGGSLKRLAVKNAVNGVVRYPDVNDSSITARSAQLGDAIAPGSSRYYQVYYRDPVVAFCGATSTTFNVSSAIRIDW